MTQLFGGFGREFYEAYEAVWPLPASAAGRVELYNLYHVLNHLNLFGPGYLGQAQAIIDQLLSDSSRRSHHANDFPDTSALPTTK
jgi:fructosamine-3-kinase